MATLVVPELFLTKTRISSPCCILVNHLRGAGADLVHNAHQFVLTLIVPNGVNHHHAGYFLNSSSISLLFHDDSDTISSTAILIGKVES